MQKFILSVDLSKAARDFIGVSLNDLPLLDKANANDRKLRKQLGRLAAQPECQGEQVHFFVCDDAGGRPHDVVCEPATDRDLLSTGDFKSDLESLRKRLTQVEPLDLRNTLQHHLEETFKANTARQSGNFYKWKTPGGSSQLVWCWGYQRRDSGPAQNVICPACRSLYVRHEDARNCPQCGGKGAAGEREGAPKTARRSWGAIAGVVVVVLAVAAFAFWMGRGQILPPDIDPKMPRLVADPPEWTGPVGGRVEFVVLRNSGDGTQEDVTRNVVARSDLPKVARFDRVGTRTIARSPGKCVVTFHLGDETAQATMSVVPPQNPKRLLLQPEKLVVGVGATKPLQMIGEYEGGEKIDLTEVAEWTSADGSKVFVHRGLVEGLVAGTAEVHAKYRATPEQPWLEATAQVEAKDEEYKSLNLSFEREKLEPGQSTGVEVTVTAKSGQKYSVAGSSHLKLQVAPTQIGRIDHGLLNAVQPGTGKLLATFQKLSAEAPFAVKAEATHDTFEVLPKSLSLAVGEVAELEISSSRSAPLQMVSSLPHVVEVREDRRVVGRTAGKATLVVSQEDKHAEVEVDVRREQFKSLAIIPEHLSVAVDETVPMRVVGRTDEGAEIDLAVDQVRAERLPSPAFVDFNVSTLEARGVQPTAGAPLTVTLRMNDLKASATIDVVSAPMQLAVTPLGPIALPKGQTSRLQIWANYGDGRRVEVPRERIEWQLAPNQVEGLSFDHVAGVATATADHSEPLKVTARYQGKSSEPVIIESAKAAPLTLVFDPQERSLLVGETGRFSATLRAVAQHEMAADGAEFVASDPSKLTVDRRTGTFTALAAGDVDVSASHPAAAPAKHSFHIAAQGDGKLVFRPASLKLPEGLRKELTLVLVTEAGERTLPVASNSEIHFANADQEAVRWEPPALVGVRPSRRPFEFAATWQGKTATAIVEVTKRDSQTPAEIRVVPAEISLALGQPFSPRVEQKLPGTESEWAEVRPDGVQWKYAPGDVVWTPASAELAPQLELAPSASDKVTLEAKYSGAHATLVISKKSPSDVPKATDANVGLTVDREPAGESLAAGQQQRYSILVEKAGQKQPAVNVEWLPAFENEFVSWQPPVLTALRAGHLQHLSATVDGRDIGFDTRIVGSTPAPSNELPRTQETPKLVRIVSGKKATVQVPVGAEFTDFQVEAEFDRGATRDVTRVAQLSVADDSAGAAVSVSSGRITAVRVGSSVVHAEFQGVRSQDGMTVDVVQTADVKALAIEPAELKLAVGQTVNVRAVAYQEQGGERVPMGDVSSAPGLVWENKNPTVLKAAGASLTALATGKATLIAKLGTATAALDVLVEDGGGQQGQTVEVAPQSLRLQVGESKSLGTDIRLSRGGAEVTGEAEVVSSQPGIAKVDSDRDSVFGVAPGDAELAFTYGGQRSILPVTVEPASEPQANARVVVEPTSGTLAVGESKKLRVFLLSKSGERIDRTAAAVLKSSNDAVLAVRGNELLGRGAGQAEISAVLSDGGDPGKAQFTVENQEFTAVEVSPPELKLATGEERQLRIEGVGPSGRREITNHPDLVITAGGQNQAAVEVRGRTIRGAGVGQATIDVRLGKLTGNQVAVTVTDEPWHDLRIEPAELEIGVKENRTLLVFAKRGNNERALTPADDVKMRLSNTSIARIEDPFTVVGTSPGITTVSVQLGSLRAEAKVTVNEGKEAESPATPPGMSPGLRFIPELLSLQMGTPGASVRVVKVSRDGKEEDADQGTNLMIVGPSDVVEMKGTAPRAVFKPVKAGTTRVSATNNGVTTQRPLVIEVKDEPQDARLDIRPNPVTLNVGQSAEFQRVQLISGVGSTPIDVGFRVTSSNDKIVAIDNGRQLRGVSAGETSVKLVPTDADARFKDLSATIPVRVNAAPPEDAKSQLVLSGPSQTTVGASAQFTIELVSDSGSKDVTSDGASLVLDRDQSELAELSPGGIIIGKKEGTVNVKARYKDLISSPATLRIDAVAKTFERLEFEIDRKPLAVGETRPYKLWGYPSASDKRQDLTNAVTTETASVAGQPRVALRPASGVADHQPPTVIAKKPGTFEMLAGLTQGSDTIRSPLLKMEVVDAPNPQDLSLTADPPAISVRVGQPAPPVRILTRGPGDSTPRQVDAELKSEDPRILAPDNSGRDKFIGQDVGRTRLVAAFGGQQVSVDVSVIANPFQDVAISKDVNLGPNNQFSVTVDVKGVLSGELEYRVVTPNAADAKEWQRTRPQGKSGSIQLVSPLLTLGPKDTVYELVLEAREREGAETERYPCSFRVILGTQVEKRSK